MPIAAGNDAPVRVLVHRPKTLPKRDNVALIMFHRGNGIALSAEADELMFSHQAVMADAVVYNVDYRLCPEANATQVAMDGVAVIRYLWDNADEQGIDAKKIGLYGMEGGGYVAAAVCGLLASMHLSTLVKIAILNCPVDTGYMASEIKSNMSQLTQMTSYYGIYLAENLATELRRQKNDKDPVLLPSLAKDSILKQWPATVILTSEYSGYKEPALLFADRLAAASDRLCERVVYPGCLHAFHYKTDSDMAPKWFEDWTYLVQNYLHDS